MYTCIRTVHKHVVRLVNSVCTLLTAPILPQLPTTSDCVWSCIVTGHCTTVSSTHPTPQPSEWKCMCVNVQCESTCTHVQYVHTYIHVCTQVCMNICKYVHLYKHTYCTYSMYVCTYIHTYIHIVCTASAY